MLLSDIKLETLESDETGFPSDILYDLYNTTYELIDNIILLQLDTTENRSILDSLTESFNFLTDITTGIENRLQFLETFIFGSNSLSNSLDRARLTFSDETHMSVTSDLSDNNPYNISNSISVRNADGNIASVHSDVVQASDTTESNYSQAQKKANDKASFKNRIIKSIDDKIAIFHSTIDIQLKNIKFQYEETRNSLKDLKNTISILKGDDKPTNKFTSTLKDKKKGGFLSSLVKGIATTMLATWIWRKLSPMLSPIIQHAVKHVINFATRFFKAGIGTLLKSLLTVARGALSISRKTIKAALDFSWLNMKKTFKTAKGLISKAKSIVQAISNIVIKVANAAKDVVINGGKSILDKSKGIAKSAIKKAPAMAKNVSGLAKKAVGFLGKGLKGGALRTVASLALRGGALVLGAAGGSLAIPLLIAAAAAGVGFGAYKLAKYFKLNEKLNAFIGKVSKGKYKGIGDFLWGVATGDVSIDLFHWVKNKVASIFEDSLTWIKEKAKQILGQFSPFDDERDALIKKETKKSKEKKPTNSFKGDKNKTKAPLQATPTLNTQALPTSEITGSVAVKNYTNGAVYFGDRFAKKQKDSDTSGVGIVDKKAGPKTILANIKKFIAENPNRLKGAKVVLSSGLAEYPADIDAARKQLEVLTAAGANVKLLPVPTSLKKGSGAGAYTGADINKKLVDLAKNFSNVAIQNQGSVQSDVSGTPLEQPGVFKGVPYSTAPMSEQEGKTAQAASAKNASPAKDVARAPEKLIAANSVLANQSGVGYTPSVNLSKLTGQNSISNYTTAQLSNTSTDANNLFGGAANPIHVNMAQF